MSHASVLVAVLVTISAAPVLPAFLGLVRNHRSGAIRSVARAAATLCLFICFVESFAGVLAIAVQGVLPLGGLAVLACVVVFVITACVVSWRVAQPTE